MKDDPVLREMMAAMDAAAALPPRPRCFMAHHSVPYGRLYRQWNTRGELLLWVNRGEVADLAASARIGKRPSQFDLAAIPFGDVAVLAAIPVVNAS